MNDQPPEPQPDPPAQTFRFEPTSSRTPPPSGHPSQRASYPPQQSPPVPPVSPGTNNKAFPQYPAPAHPPQTPKQNSILEGGSSPNTPAVGTQNQLVAPHGFAPSDNPDLWGTPSTSWPAQLLDSRWFKAASFVLAGVAVSALGLIVFSSPTQDDDSELTNRLLAGGTLPALAMSPSTDQALEQQMLGTAPYAAPDGDFQLYGMVGEPLSPIDDANPSDEQDSTEADIWEEPTVDPQDEWIDAGNGVLVPDVLLRVRFCESTNNYLAAHRYSSARGAYQFLRGSWEWYGHAERYGVPEANLATPAQQDEAAVKTVLKDGLRPWAASKHCWASPNINPNYRSANAPNPPPTSTSTTTQSTTSSSLPDSTTSTSPEPTTESTVSTSSSTTTTTSSTSTPETSTTSDPGTQTSDPATETSDPDTATK